MSTPVKHHTHGKVGRRRSHLAIKATNILACSECKAPILPHRVCGNCGTMHTHALRAARGLVKAKPFKAAAVAAPVVAEAAIDEEVPADETPTEAVDEVVETSEDTPAEETE